jgi:Mat/Ecp fimbriae major subunit
MKTMFKAALAATVATGLFAAPAMAANSATKPFTATAKIVRPLTLVNTSLLDFGIITMSNTFAGGDVVISRAGVVTCDPLLTCTGTPKAGAFDVTGVANQGLTVTVQPTALLTDVVSGDTLAFVTDAPGSITLDSAGLKSFNIGGTITVPVGASDGTYGADIDVTVTYS